MLPQLVKRILYVFFVWMSGSSLFESLYVTHASTKCPICGKWFLTADARETNYYGGLAPGDKLGRTCRQIGNLKDREQRELADDHPIKAIYTRRMNTITQYLRRGTLDKSTADKMKQRWQAANWDERFPSMCMLRAAMKKKYRKMPY